MHGLAANSPVQTTSQCKRFSGLLASIVTTALIVYSAPGLAVNSEYVDLSGELDLNTPKISWMPGERYDPRKGSMNYTSTDLSMPGNGKLSIEIKRTFNHIVQTVDLTSSGTIIVGGGRSFGLMALAIPKLSFEMNTGTRDGCFQRTGFSLSTEGDSLDRKPRNLETPLIFNDGEQEVVFYEVNDDNRHLAQSSDLPDMDFISPDNWGIQCLDPDAVSAITVPATFSSLSKLLNVYSPDGTVYRMRSVGGRGIHSRKRGIIFNYTVERVEDAYGNSLTYTYKRFSRGEGNGHQRKLSSIAANDGRLVQLDYEAVRVRRPDKLHKAWRISTITGNGQPNPRQVRYEYGNNYLKVTEHPVSVREYVISGGNIESITYPTGAKISYTYDGTFKVAENNYAMLATRTSQPDGGLTRFEYHPHPTDSKIYSRLIRTPSSTTEYRYKVSSATRFNKPKPYDVDSGKQLRYRVFDDPEVSWPPISNESVLLDRSYSYKSLYRIASHLVRQDMDRIVLDKVVSRMNPWGQTAYRSVFATEYKSYDFRGYPVEIIEQGGNPYPPSSKSRTITISYEHDDFDFWILGMPTVIDIDGVDVTEKNYNVKGDTKFIKKNGKTIVSNRWHMHGRSKGELHYIVNGQGGETVYTNYHRGKARNILNPTGRYQFVQVNTDGTVRSKTRFGDTAPTTYTYDALRRLATVDPARQSAETRKYYWDSSSRVRMEVGRGRLILDEFGRTVAEERYDSSFQRRTVIREYAYDTEGRLIFESNPRNKFISQDVVERPDPGQSRKRIGREYSYDGLGRVTTVATSARDGAKDITSYIYTNANKGNLVIVQSDGRGSKTLTEYISYGTPDYQWPVLIIEPGGTSSVIERNSLGNVLSHARDNLTTTYEYNAQNLVQHIVRPDDSLTALEYYDDGSLLRRSNNGRSVRYYYYPDLRIKQEDHIDRSGGHVINEYYYSERGNLKKTITASHDGSQNNEVVYSYDEDNNLLTESLVMDGGRLDMVYTYDSWSNRKTIQYPNGNRYLLEPNYFGDPTSIRQDGGAGKEILGLVEYHPDNSAKLLKRGGHEIEMLIDEGMRPKYYKLRRAGSGQPLSSREYFFDEANNVSRINDHVNNRYSTFEYDKRDRLKNAYISGADDWAFSYLNSGDIDWIQHGGRRANYTYVSGTSRLRKVDQNGVVRRFEYDDHGNIVKHERITESGGVARMNIKFNAANQVVKMSDGTKFAYDARGLRVKKDLNGPIYSFYDSAKKLIFRKDVGAGVTSEYFYVGGKLVARRDVDQSGGAQAGSEAPVAAAPSETVAPTQSADERPPVPATLWPANDGVGSTPEYMWTAVLGATRYEIVTREPDTNEQWVYEQLSASQTGCSQGEEKCRFTKEDSSLSGAKRWAVRSENAAGFSQWSEWRHFSVRN